MSANCQSQTANSLLSAAVYSQLLTALCLLLVINYFLPLVFLPMRMLKGCKSNGIQFALKSIFRFLQYTTETVQQLCDI